MRLALAAWGLVGMALTACAPIAVNSMDHATRALEPRVELEETVQRYVSNICYGQIDAAAESVEPALRNRFKSDARKLQNIRFTDSRIEHLDFGPDRSSAEAVVVYKGYWLSSPFEREIRVVQRWRRVKTFDWVVSPDLDVVIAGPSGSTQPPAAPAL